MSEGMMDTKSTSTKAAETVAVDCIEIALTMAAVHAEGTGAAELYAIAADALNRYRALLAVHSGAGAITVHERQALTTDAYNAGFKAAERFHNVARRSA